MVIPLRVIEDCEQALDENKHVAANLMGLSKAFDCLPHDLLPLKLKTYALLFVHSSFAIILKRQKSGFFAIIVLQMYCYYKCSVTLPHGAVGWSAVCDCGIS